MSGVVGLWQRYQASHLGRALRHYGLERGQILAGGLAYVALFSLSAILVLLFAVFGQVLASNRTLLDSVVSTINGYVPGLLGGDGIDPQALLDTNALSTAGVKPSSSGSGPSPASSRTSDAGYVFVTTTTVIEPGNMRPLS